MLLPGTYTVNVQQPPEVGEWPSRTIEDVQITEDTTLDIALEAGVLLSGRVTDPEGGPVINASINIWDPVSGQSGWGQTSSDGSYRIVLVPGTYAVNIQPPEGSGLASRIEGIELTVDTSLDVVLEPGFLLSGRVTDSEGKEIFPVIIIAQEPGMEWGEYIPAVAEGDTDGSYRMRLMGGTYDLLVFEFVEDQSSGVGRKLVDVEVSADRTLDVVLPSSESAFTLSGTVTDDEGRGIAGLWIEAYDPATANYALAFTQGDGTYTMKVPPGTYDLTVLAFLRSGLPKGRIKGVQITGDIR